MAPREGEPIILAPSIFFATLPHCTMSEPSGLGLFQPDAAVGQMMEALSCLTKFTRQAEGNTEPMAIYHVNKAAGTEVCGRYQGYAVLEVQKTTNYQGGLYMLAVRGRRRSGMDGELGDAVSGRFARARNIISVRSLNRFLWKNAPVMSRNWRLLPKIMPKISHMLPKCPGGRIIAA